jgi:hypothetical protein
MNPRLAMAPTLIGDRGCQCRIPSAVEAPSSNEKGAETHAPFSFVGNRESTNPSAVKFDTGIAE